MDDLILNKIKEIFSDSILEVVEFRSQFTCVVRKHDLPTICRFLRDDPEMMFNFLSCISGVDFPERDLRFDVVYELYSISKNHRLRLKVKVNQEESVPSITSIWRTANWHEREVFDLFGINFEGHPDLRRILLPDDYEGHPLRKDFPLTREEVAFSHNLNRPPKIE